MASFTKSYAGLQPWLAIVDDQADTLDVPIKYLKSLNFRVRAFQSIQRLLQSLDWGPTIDCVISDIRYWEADGVHLLETIRSFGVLGPVVLTANQSDMALAVRALKAGASDIVEKPIQPAALAGAVQAAIVRSSSERNKSSQIWQARANLSQLTERQTEVIEMIVRGLTSKEIATGLNISHRTVEAHRLRIMDKLGIGSLTELIKMKVVAELSEHKSVDVKPND